jgi:hypothetical protein
MRATEKSTRPAGALTIALAAAAMIAGQVGGKAARDAFFLSNFEVTALPAMLIAGAVASLAVILVASRAMVVLGPARLVPASFAGSALLLLGEWALAARAPRVAAVVFYLHMAAFGAVLISGFWSSVNELFDPRTAKRRVSQIAAGGALGGLLGGILAERVGASMAMTAMLPMVAALQVLCGAALAAAVRGGSRGSRPAPGPAALVGGLLRGPRAEIRMVKGIPYLRDLAALVLIGTVSAALLDYVFKSQASATYSRGGDLMRFFAAFHTGVGLLVFLVQTGLSRFALERLGLARTAATLPFAVGVSGIGALAVPGLTSSVVARGVEAVLHGSLFRSSYELLFTPLPEGERRATKTIVDAGFDRLGDIAGGAVVALLLLLGPTAARPAMVALAISLAIVGLFVARRLHAGYVGALARSLRSQAVALDLDQVSDQTTRSTLLQTMADLDGTMILRRIAAVESEAGPAGAPATARGVAAAEDPLVARIAALHSGDAARVRDAVARSRPADALVAGHLVPLLGRDDVAREAIEVLREAAPRITGLLVDRLLDPQEDLVVRRRLPGVVAAARSQRAVDGLFDALADARFEVRFRCGRALLGLRGRDAGLTFDWGRVQAAVQREVAVGRRVWESQRAVDPIEDRGEASFVEDFLRERASRSLEHVCTLLALVLDEGPLRIAFRGLQTTDQNLRGTALEYLESVLPQAIREGLWPYLDDHRGRPQRAPAGRAREVVLDDLLRSSESIQINLSELRRRLNAGDTPPAGPAA